MINNKSFLLTFFLLICILEKGFSQETPDSLQRWYVKMKDKNIFIGRVLEKDRRTVLMETESIGTIRIPKRKIRYAELYHPEMMIDGVYWPKYRLPHHNTFTPTGKIGRSYYQNIFYIFHNINVKINERMSMSTGLIPIVTSDAEGLYFWLSPKFSIPVKAKNIDLSVGYWGGFTLVPDDILAGIPYGVGTYSNEFFSASIGLGFGMAGKKVLKWPFYTANILLRTKNRAFINIEILGGGDFGSFINLTARKQGKKRIWDFGWIIRANREIPQFDFFGGPYIGAVTPFGQVRL